MGYALFAQRKLMLTGRLQSYQLMQTQRSDEQFVLATEQTNLKQQLSALQAAQATELAELYEMLSLEPKEGGDRDSIRAQISEKENEFKTEQQDINNQVYQVSLKENAFQQEVKRLDTCVAKLEKELEAIQQAEQNGIEKSVPKFSFNG